MQDITPTEEELRKGKLIDFRNNDIVWTASSYWSGNPSFVKDELPYVHLVEYEQEWSGTIATINYWANRAADPGGLPYSGLYLGRPTDNEYILPYFSENHHQINQAWQETKAPLGTMGKKALDQVTDLAQVILPAAGMIYPRAYAGATPQTYDITFTLFNTVNTSDKNVSILKNKIFIERFLHANLHDQVNAVSIIPPCLYEVYIPGVRWSPAAVVSNLTVANKGTLNRIKGVGGGEYIVPDAWEVSIQMTELLNESKDIFTDAIQGHSSNDRKMTVSVIQTIGQDTVDENEQNKNGRDDSKDPAVVLATAQPLTYGEEVALNPNVGGFNDQNTVYNVTSP